jgi:hypothetical protein
MCNSVWWLSGSLLLSLPVFISFTPPVIFHNCSDVLKYTAALVNFHVWIPQFFSVPSIVNDSLVGICDFLFHVVLVLSFHK